MNFRNSTALLFAFPLVSCGTVSSFSNLAETSKKTSQTPSSSEQSALNPSNPQNPQNPQNPPVPPVEVTGSFLTGVLFDESAAEIPDAKLKIKETNFQTQTDTKGR
ncbi:MAG: hypothetical protein EBR09_09525, partial [Proteobacteria bacterium]|nr:hypothetical protein [Pseudomonadota bacterium]